LITSSGLPINSALPSFRNIALSQCSLIELISWETRIIDLPYFDLGLYDRHFEIKYQPMNYNLRKSLKEYFEPYNSKLYKYLSIDFQWEQKLHGKKESKGI